MTARVRSLTMKLECAGDGAAEFVRRMLKIFPDANTDGNPRDYEQDCLWLGSTGYLGIDGVVVSLVRSGSERTWIRYGGHPCNWLAKFPPSVLFLQGVHTEQDFPAMYTGQEVVLAHFDPPEGDFTVFSVIDMVFSIRTLYLNLAGEAGSRVEELRAALQRTSPDIDMINGSRQDRFYATDDKKLLWAGALRLWFVTDDPLHPLPAELYIHLVQLHEKPVHFFSNESVRALPGKAHLLREDAHVIVCCKASPRALFQDDWHLAFNWFHLTPKPAARDFPPGTPMRVPHSPFAV